MRSGLVWFGVLGLAAALAGALFLYSQPRADNSATRIVVVGADRFTLLGGYLRSSSRGGGRLDHLDLAAFFPAFTPAGEAGDIDSKTDLSERYEKLVFVTLRPADPGLDPSERPAKLYDRFLEPDGWSHPGGLIARAFQAGSPFEGQELYFVAPEGRVFAARCGRSDQAQKTPNSCVYDFRLGGLDVEVRFPAALLSEWEKLNAGVRGLILASQRAS
jgi:hypothetical protein